MSQQIRCLHPWLLLNICIMYEGKQKKEELFSIGLNLINGSFVFEHDGKLKKISNLHRQFPIIVIQFRH